MLEYFAKNLADTAQFLLDAAPPGFGIHFTDPIMNAVYFWCFVISAIWVTKDAFGVGFKQYLRYTLPLHGIGSFWGKTVVVIGIYVSLISLCLPLLVIMLATGVYNFAADFKEKRWPSNTKLRSFDHELLRCLRTENDQPNKNCIDPEPHDDDGFSLSCTITEYTVQEPEDEQEAAETAEPKQGLDPNIKLATFKEFVNMMLEHAQQSDDQEQNEKISSRTRSAKKRKLQ